MITMASKTGARRTFPGLLNSKDERSLHRIVHKVNEARGSRKVLLLSEPSVLEGMVYKALFTRIGIKKERLLASLEVEARGKVEALYEEIRDARAQGLGRTYPCLDQRDFWEASTKEVGLLVETDLKLAKGLQSVMETQIPLINILEGIVYMRLMEGMNDDSGEAFFEIVEPDFPKVRKLLKTVTDAYDGFEKVMEARRTTFSSAKPPSDDHL